jgi:hypothetical protein
VAVGPLGGEIIPTLIYLETKIATKYTFALSTRERALVYVNVCVDNLVSQKKRVN